jgi:squalene synthase HpnC
MKLPRRWDFPAQLAQFGPRAQERLRLTPREAGEYCCWLARTHYENFTVASWLLPKHLRQHFYNVYAYCRWSDDLADEVGDAARSLDLLDWWQTQLDDCYRGRAVHPVFVALLETIEQFEIPPDPFRNLLIAFRQDQHKTRYDTFDELLGYCRNSANPVGHLVLYLGRAFNDENAQLADEICTGLQLANFWQDVARDFDRGRVYLPRETLDRFGYDDAMLERREFNDAFANVMRHEVDRAEAFFERGRPLVRRMPRELRIDVELFLRGGLEVLAAIRRIGYDVWRTRPVVGKWRKLWLVWSAWGASRGVGE